MKITKKILLAFFLISFFTFDASAFILRFKGFGGEGCIAWGRHDCPGKGIAFKGDSADYSLIINGKEVSTEEVTVFSKESSYNPNAAVEVVYRPNPIKFNKLLSKESMSKESVNKEIKLVSTSEKILIKNKRTGEIISLSSILEISESCKG